MDRKKFIRLVKRGFLNGFELEGMIREASASGLALEELLIARGVPRHEVLFSLKEYYAVPFIEYSESVIVSPQITRRMDMERLKRALWLPIALTRDCAEVIACRPDDPAVLKDIRNTLHVEQVVFFAALHSDLVSIIEHNQDLNPGFPLSAGRTPLAAVRTFLAEQRSRLSCARTTLAKGRTGLAFLRTGISFITIALVLLRIFGAGYLMPGEAVLFMAGLVMAIDGMIWYLPSRREGKRSIVCTGTKPTGGTSVLEIANPGDAPVFTRTPEVAGAKARRSGWNNLSPVMRRRFLASDRTDLAEERTLLACYRTLMARARTGLSFTRSGFAFVGLGIALFRQFRGGPWTTVDAILIVLGAAMIAEGFYWYLPGHRAGLESCETVKSSECRQSIWDAVLPPLFNHSGVEPGRHSFPQLSGIASPGIRATTGLALERTVLAERRNVMARLRTVMARSRTGMAFIRTGMAIAAVGFGLLVYFGTGNALWTVFDVVMILGGIMFMIDGLYWHVPAERTRKQFPYCFGDMEIAIPDYGMPSRSWKRAVFNHDEL